MVQIKKKDTLYYARILPNTGIYEVCELVIRTVTDVWFVGIDKKDKHAYLFYYKDIDKILFYDRNIALAKVLESESNMSNTEFTIKYEEY